MRLIRRGFFALLGVSIATGIMIFNYSQPMQQLRNMPSQIYAGSDGARSIAIGRPFELEVEGGEMQVLSGMDQSLSDVTVVKPEGEVATVHVTLFGVLPVKEVKVLQRSSRKLIPGGTCIGVTLYTRGALVVGTSQIQNASGFMRNPAAEAGLMAGDVIEKVDGVAIVDATHLSSLINEQDGRAISLEIRRGGKKESVTVQPVQDAQDGRFRLGIWVRDSTAGVGTLTFYDPATNWFGALGHAITDIDTKSNLIVRKGEIIAANIIDIRQGERGEPGELKGTFDQRQKALGDIRKNTDFGIYGTMYGPFVNSLYPDGLPIAHQDEVTEGDALLLTTIDDTGIQAFSCTVTRITSQATPSPKGMIVRVTDERLLGATGGIVQGMSGSPLIQNGRIIGAVTHVFVNDPTRGYGMFIDWMLEQVGAP